MSQIGQNIKMHRERLQMSQEELGSMVGVKRSAIQKYEKGVVTNIPMQTVVKFAEIFDTTPQELFGWSIEEQILSQEAKVIQCIDQLYGKPAVMMLELFTELSDIGQQRVIQYMIDLTRAYPKIR